MRECLTSLVVRALFATARGDRAVKAIEKRTKTRAKRRQQATDELIKKHKKRLVLPPTSVPVLDGEAVRRPLFEVGATPSNFFGAIAS